MAIIVEEKKQSSLSILYIGIWAILIIFVIIGFYYVFFKNPEIYEKLSSSSSSDQINQIVNLSSNVDFNSVIQNKTFQSLKSYIDIPQDIPSGKENPFQ
jgi:uncharacterized membrane protein YukC